MKVYLFTVEALDELDAPQTLRFASGSYDADGLDWEYRLKQPALFTTSAFSGGVLSDSRSGFGESVILNPDGAMNYLTDYAFDGRVAELFIYDKNTDTLTKLLSGTVSVASFDRSSISFKLRDPQEELNLEHPQDLYLGNNSLPAGLEGVATDIKGKRKPKVYGEVLNASPYLVNTSRLIYEVSSLSCTVNNVYDRGVALTKGTDYISLAELESTPPAAGNFRVYQGYFRLGSSPTGTVTCDATGANVLVGDVFDEIVQEGGYTVVAADVTAINAYGEVGIFLKDTKRTSELLDLLAASVGAYWTFDLSRVINIKILEAALTEDIELDDYEVLAISRSATGAGPNGLPAYKVTVKADKIETIQNDLAGAVSDVTKARLANEYRDSVATSTATKTRHLLADEVVIQSALRNLTDSQAVADRLLTLLSVRRDLLEVTFKYDEINAAVIGTNIKITIDRFGYESGKVFKVLGLTIDAKKNQMTVNLFG